MRNGLKVNCSIMTSSLLSHFDRRWGRNRWGGHHYCLDGGASVVDLLRVLIFFLLTRQFVRFVTNVHIEFMVNPVVGIYLGSMKALISFLRVSTKLLDRRLHPTSGSISMRVRRVAFTMRQWRYTCRRQMGTMKMVTWLVVRRTVITGFAWHET